MTPKEMWQAYKKINPVIGDEINAWAFGTLADQLADLVLRGEKTATASAYELYKLENEPLPQVGSFDVILDSQDQAVCIVEITKVSVLPFKEVSAEHAFKPKDDAVPSPAEPVVFFDGGQRNDIFFSQDFFAVHDFQFA